MKIASLVLFLIALPLAAQQQQSTTALNPLTQLKEEVGRVLAEANVPFTEDEEKAIVLMMEDRRRASEDLFGDLFDFRAGPTRGQEADRLNSAIQWLQNEFLNRLQDYLTPGQLTVWSRYREASSSKTPETNVGGAAPQNGRAQQNQTQYVRINNNSFTSEDQDYRNGGFGGGGNRGTEVIQRGGSGAFHGNAQFLFKDAKLNANKRFASNKPPYQERQTTFDMSGPLIPGRLTTGFSINRNEAQDVDTVNATLLTGVFALGITRPTVNQGVSVQNTYQLSDSTALSLNGSYRTNSSKNQGVGGFALPERAYVNAGNNWNVQVKQFSALSARTIFEAQFNLTGDHDTITPKTESLRVNVTDAFSIGGAQNGADNTVRNYNFSTLYTQLGEKWTFKTGLEGVHRKRRSISNANFIGTFSFSSLDNYRNGIPNQFRQLHGNPVTKNSQLELGLFLQNDLKLSPRLTLMFGGRYQVQSNIKDHNNFGPRLSMAYAIGRATVIRAGVGVFHQMLPDNKMLEQQRLSGQQYEIVINNPTYPDPFQGGEIRNPSVRVTDPHLVVPYESIAMASYERTLLGNLFFNVTVERDREVHRTRLRNLNAAMDTTSLAPASCQPGQSQATCMRLDPTRANVLSLEPSASSSRNTLRLSMRERFSILNVTANYTWSTEYLDSQPVNNLGNANAAAGYGIDGLNTDQYALHLDWGSTTQPKHQGNMTVNAQLPLGLFLTGTMNAGGARRYSIMTGKDDNQDGTINDRPAGVGRNTGLGPGTLNFNFNISKAIFFGPRTGNSRTNMNVFANMTNAFNRPNYSPPSGVMSSPNFGRSTGAGSPREIEVGVRYQF